MNSEFEKWFATDTGCSLEGARRYAEKNPHMVKCYTSGIARGKAIAVQIARSCYCSDADHCGCINVAIKNILPTTASTEPEVFSEWESKSNISISYVKERSKEIKVKNTPCSNPPLQAALKEGE